jgi:Flp pilus assembly pilin Flp
MREGGSKNPMHQKLLQLHQMFQILIDCQDGQDLVEYALLLTMISLALISAVDGIATAVTGVFTAISGSMASA